MELLGHERGERASERLEIGRRGTREARPIAEKARGSDARFNATQSATHNVVVRGNECGERVE